MGSEAEALSKDPWKWLLALSLPKVSLLIVSVKGCFCPECAALIVKKLKGN